MSRASYASLLALLLLAGLWPWFGELALWPMAPDSATWIERADPSAPDWLEWTFLTSHFDVGWRPLTALAFTADRLLFGLEPLGYRLTDLALHALTAVLVACLARRLTRAAPRWTGLVAAAVFLAHPVADEVVPFLARRSYALGSALGLAAALVLLGHDERSDAPGPSVSRTLAAGTLLALAVAANEVSVLFAAALPGLLLVDSRSNGATRMPGRSRALFVVRRAAWLALPLALVVAARLSVVGGVGGYELPDEAEAEGGRRALEVFTAAWRELGAVARPPASLGSIPLWIAVLLVLPGLALAAASHRAGLVLALWTAAYPALYATQGVWFPRQAYVAVVPLALLVALLAGDLAATWTARPPATRLRTLAPLAAAAGLLLASTPLLRGPDPERTAERSARNALIDAALADLRLLAAEHRGPEPLDVHLVLPYAPPRERDDALRARAAERDLSRASRLPARWLGTLMEGTAVQPLEFVYVLREPQDTAPLASREGERTIRIRAGAPYHLARDTKGGKQRMEPHGEAGERKLEAPVGRLWLAP